MIIRDMFQYDINRQINGVIKVDQSAEDVTEQELNEYVVTKELKKHFITFFNYYSDAFDRPTSDTGVWISGFFGSGKSHFLKMLSYILENKEVKGIKSAEYLRNKFENDPATFMLIDRSTKAPTETILFDIDIEGSINKDKTAVLRVFAKMFYKHLGFYGENLKVAKLEQFIAQQGKTEEFRKVFEQKKGQPWVEARKVFRFNGKFIIPTLMEVLDISEEDAKAWFNDKTSEEFSIAQLVEDIKAYVDTKPADFRLLFMVDEVGQYTGTDTDMLLNLQSIVEKVGSECSGKVWIVCTGQEAIDEIIKVRSDEFSRIQARFKTRLSLSSSSVDEVIQKRVLKKNKESEKLLSNVYDKNDSVLRNLFSFTESIMDIKGYTGPNEFAVNFPFVPYQFIIMQKAFAEIRKHGNSGKHMSGAERSMLSGFQEAAQKIQEKNEYALVPFFRFYDTVHTFLDGSIRRVIERCQRAADNHNGIEQEDIDVLKLLYLIRYIDDIPSNINNIVILMADDIRMDKIAMREKVKASLGRLMEQNYIGRTGDVYNFLTDEEQDIQREIKNIPVDTAAIVERIAQIIYGDIYQTKKYRYGKYDFAFDQMVDGITIGNITGGMRLKFLTIADDSQEKSEFHIMAESKDKAAIVVLAQTPYYESLESAMKIRKYVKQRNVNQLPRSVQDIIRTQQDEATKYENTVKEELIKAIEGADFYADGEKLDIRSGNAVNKIDAVMEYLVEHVYSELNLIEKNADSDAEIEAILNGSDRAIPGFEPNRNAAAKIEEYLEMQEIKRLPTSMADIQSRYSAIPYGWKEIDIAAVTARLIIEQKVTLKYAGATVQPDNPKIIDMLRKKSETGRVTISKRQKTSEAKIRQVKDILRELFDVMDVPDDEDGLVAFITEKFTELKAHYNGLNERYQGKRYPEHGKVESAIKQTDKILNERKDNIALIDAVIREEDNLFNTKDDMQNVEGFFRTQVQIFDAAVKMENDMRNDLSYIKKEEKANEALNQIRLITQVLTDAQIIYHRIPELNRLMAEVKAGHDRLLQEKKDEIFEFIRQCMEKTHGMINGDPDKKEISDKADKYFDGQKENIRNTVSIALLDSLMPQIGTYTDGVCKHMEDTKIPEVTAEPAKEVPKAKNIKRVYRQIAFPAKTLQTKEDVENYTEDIKNYLLSLLDSFDGITLN